MTGSGANGRCGDEAMRRLQEVIRDELTQRVNATVVELAASLAARAKGATAAVLYYGSGLRDETVGGVLDFYVLLDDVGAWPGSSLAVLANRVLPPNVAYLEMNVGGHHVRAKYAVMSTAQFRAAMSWDTIDTTLWARFSQPCRCVFTRSAQDLADATGAIARAVVTAARWAAELGPRRALPEDFWRALFARTYVAELRVERASRGHDLVGHDAARYAAVLPLAWESAGLAFDSTVTSELAPALDVRRRRVASRRWRLRARSGKLLNGLRLLKAACTFDGAADYVVWKVERHSGVRIEMSAWQRRHPLLAAPGIYLRLRRQGVLR